LESPRKERENLDITLFIAGASDIKNVVADLPNKVMEEFREAYPNARKQDTLHDNVFS